MDVSGLAGAISRQVIFEFARGIGIRLEEMGLAPMRFLLGRVEAFGKALPGEAAEHRAHGHADGGTDRPGEGAESSERHGAARRADAGAYGMSAGFTGERVGVGVVLGRSLRMQVGIHGIKRRGKKG
jgi:hypothetical protein